MKNSLKGCVVAVGLALGLTGCGENSLDRDVAREKDRRATIENRAIKLAERCSTETDAILRKSCMDGAKWQAIKED